MLTVHQLAYLASKEGEDLIARAATLSASGNLLECLTRLRREFPAPLASASVEMVELRKRAARKFPKANRMLFTRDGLEQSTGETIARWRAAFFPAGATILDLCCGI